VKRFLVLAGLVAALMVVFAPAATPAAPDAKGPPCADMFDSDLNYSSGSVTGPIFLEAPACSRVTYTLYVTTASGSPLGSSSQYTTACTAPAGKGCIQFNVSAPTSDAFVCVYAETTIGGHLIDYGPNPDRADPSCTAQDSLAISTTGGTGGGTGMG
jgi:hypothetical protein